MGGRERDWEKKEENMPAQTINTGRQQANSFMTYIDGISRSILLKTFRILETLQEI